MNKEIKQIMRSDTLHCTHISDEEVNGSFNCHFTTEKGVTVVGRFVPDFVEVYE